MFAFTASAQTNRATFPADFDKYVLYATYDRGSSKEEAFANPETLEIAKSGQPLPPGTQIVLGIWQDYKLTGYFVMEKGEGWGLEVSEEMRTGDWHFQQFDTEGRSSGPPSRSDASPATRVRPTTTSCSRSTECGPIYREQAVSLSPCTGFSGGQPAAGRLRLQLAGQCSARSYRHGPVRAANQPQYLQSSLVRDHREAARRRGARSPK